MAAMAPRRTAKRHEMTGAGGWQKPWTYPRLGVPPHVVESARKGLLTFVSQVRIRPGPLT
jgi:hypothetical protein